MFFTVCYHEMHQIIQGVVYRFTHDLLMQYVVHVYYANLLSKIRMRLLQCPRWNTIWNSPVFVNKGFYIMHFTHHSLSFFLLISLTFNSEASRGRSSSLQRAKRQKLMKNQVLKKLKHVKQSQTTFERDLSLKNTPAARLSQECSGDKIKYEGRSFMLNDLTAI